MIKLSSPQLVVRSSTKAPTGGERICRFLDVGDVAPPAVPQKRMSEFVSDHVEGERFTAGCQFGPEDNAATAAANRAGASHPQRPAFARDIVLQSDPKSRIIQKVPLDRFGKTIQDSQDSIPQCFTFGERF